MSQFCQVLCVSKQPSGFGAAEYETVVIIEGQSDIAPSTAPNRAAPLDYADETEGHVDPEVVGACLQLLVADSNHNSSSTLVPGSRTAGGPGGTVGGPGRTAGGPGGTLVNQQWNYDVVKSSPSTVNNSDSGKAAATPGSYSSATLPNRRHTSQHVSFGGEVETLTTTSTKTTTTSSDGSKDKSQYSILKLPAKLLPQTPTTTPGRIEVIKEEMEVELVKSRSTTTTSSSMHRSVENSQSPVRQSTMGSQDRTASSESQHSLPSNTSVIMQTDRIDFPIYSEPVIVPAAFGNKLRADYYDSQGSSAANHPQSKTHSLLSSSSTLNQQQDDDPGVMSEADTTSTGFRRGGRARASLPIFREETKRAVLPNEITTLDTVKALFVRAFPKILSMEYLDRSDQRKIYVLDQRKDMFYELEDLRDVRDRSVLKILEADQLQPAPPTRESVSSQLGQLVDEINYFSEPEFDTLADSFRHPGSHSAKIPRTQQATMPFTSSSGLYSTVGRPGSMSHSYPAPQYSAAPPVVPPKPQRSVYGCYTPLYEEPIYANASDHKRPPSRSGTATPIVDEEARYRVDAMERHLANLTDLVQQALTGNHPPGGGSASNSRRPSDSTRSNSDYANVYIAPKRPAQKGIFLRYPDPMLMEYLENVQHKIRVMLGDTQSLRRQHQSQALTMREIVKQNFERLKSQFNLVAAGGHGPPSVTGNGQPRRGGEAASSSPRTRTTNDIQAFQQEATRLSRDVMNLEAAIEEIKAAADSQKSAVRLREVDRYSTELNELSNYLSDLRLKFPDLQERMKSVMTTDMEAIIKNEIFIKEEPIKLEDMARRCKKLTGTLLNLNKMVSVTDFSREVSVDGPPTNTTTTTESPSAVPQPPARRESLTTTPPETVTKTATTGTPEQKRLDRKAQDMLDDLLSELEVFTDVSSRDTTPDRDAGSSTIKRSPKNHAKTRTSRLLQQEASSPILTASASLSPPSITPSNSSQSTNTTMSSMTDNSSISMTDNSSISFASTGGGGSDSGTTTISRVQVGVGEVKTTVSPVPASTRSGYTSGGSGKSTPARRTSETATTSRTLTDWLTDVQAPPPPPRSASNKGQSPILSPLSKTGGFFSMPSYGRTVSEPGDFEGGSSDYANVREPRSPLKDQRLTPIQQDKIGSYYISKLRKGSDPGTGTMGRSPIDDLARDILAHEARDTFFTSRVDAAFLARMEKRDPPALPPKPRTEEAQEQPPPLPPRNRQEILEERHQELLRKQRQLQEQYARLQQLQRDQKIRPSSPVNKTSTSPQSGSLNDLKRHQQQAASQQSHSKINGMDIYATPTSKPFYHHQMNITNGTMDGKTIYETDIL
ncbi:putative Coiled-coil domain-containing protein [Hypsibius exemplaris]|uniref:Coiled-coil domain-containing protein n=1 Tax=Hypsibius exemplaris TaxID=2072580 RepID=A0A1W0WV13_HYPEX|nr:putative Coiled-coil domain-containing protein [Hypsibius exemplaris]